MNILVEIISGKPGTVNLLCGVSNHRSAGFSPVFVEEIEVNDGRVKMYYTISVYPNHAREEAVGAVLIGHHD